MRAAYDETLEGPVTLETLPDPWKMWWMRFAIAPTVATMCPWMRLPPRTGFYLANLIKRGKHIQVDILNTKHRHPAVPMDLVVSHELEILGSHGIQTFEYRRMLEMITAGKLHPEKLIGRKVSLEEGIAQLTVLDRFDQTGVTVINRF